MSVRFQYAGDKDISVGRAGGVSVYSLPTAGGFPPYGTPIGSGTEPLVDLWSYAVSGRSGSFEYGYVGYILYADGSGGSFISYGSSFETATMNYVVDDYEFETNSRMIWKGIATGVSECTRAGNASGTENSGTAYVYISEAGSDYAVGSWTSILVNDGVCGTSTQYTYSYDPYGTFITSYGDYNYYSDGAGSYYSELI